MNNKFKTILTVVLALIVSACITGFVGCKSKKDDDNKKTQTSKSAVVSVWDDEMNFVDKFSYDNHDGNTINVESFKKVGYKFEGVYDAASGVMLFNANGVQSPIVMLDKDYTAVLKYSPITYQLVFEAGEGKLENTAEYIKNATYGESVGLFPATFYEGKELDGWYDENDKRYSFGTSPVNTKFTEAGFSLTEETIKLYARYSDKYYTVSLLYQDGSTDVKLKVKHGEKLPDLSEYLKDNGSRSVAGFGVSSNATEVFDQAVYTDLELYAMWRDYKNVYFCYGEDDTRVVKIFRDGSASTLPDGEKEGYVFEGWYQSELLTGNKITSVPFSSLAAVYYAKWSLGRYTISFVADGKLVSSSNFDIEEQDIFVPPVPAKDHYSGAWEDYELQYKDMTVNAVYTPDEITLSLMANGDYNYKKVVYGENYSLSVPRKKGYDFDGWFYKDQRVTDANGNSLSPYAFDGSVTLTAKFISTKVTLFFESNGGTAIDSVSVDYGTPYTLTQTPEREGFYFGGWFDETLVNEYIGAVTLTKNAIVYAKWIKSTEGYDVDGLKAIADNPYGNYHLTANINLRGEVWEPIEKFSGIFNGNGYKIYNFALKKDNADLGFFIKNQGTIKNLNLSNIEFSSTIDGNYTCSLSAFCAYNEGSLVNIAIESVNALVNVKNSSVNNTVSIGTVVGESSGKIISCTAKSSLTLNTNLHGHYGTYTTVINVGGLCGKDKGQILTAKSIWSIAIKEYVSASSDGSAVTWREGWKYAYLNVGAVCGTEYGNLTNAVVNFKCNLSSNAGGTSPHRLTHIGGVVGSVTEGGAVSNCYSYGSADLARVGKNAGSDEFYSGGVVGKVENGTVNNCASSVNLTLTEGYGGYTVGIVGCVSQSGRVSNVAYYGTVKTTAYSGGYFTGLVGLVDGVFAKAYFHGKVDTDSANAADVVAVISSSGSVSKTIDNGNTRVVFCKNDGAANDNYVIGVDYGADVLLDINTLFEKLCLYEADLWGVDEETGLYLISFPESDLAEITV